MVRSKFYAHSGTSGDREHWHRLSEHLEGTGTRAADLLDVVGGADIGRVAGLLHDLGKYTQEFQDRLSGGHQRVNHSTAGAKVAVEGYVGPLGKMLAFCIAGHHAGLANGVNGEQTTALDVRLKEKVPELDPVWEQEIALPSSLPGPRLKPRDRDTAGFCAAFLIRLLFSALVDADYLDTEDYFARPQGTPKPRGQHPTLAELRRRLDAYLDKLVAGVESSPVDDLRQEVLAHVRGKAAEPSGLSTLKVKVREVIRILERNGLEFTRRSGSHRRSKGTVKGRTRMVTVPGTDGDEVPKGTLGSIRRQSGLPARLFR